MCRLDLLNARNLGTCCVHSIAMCFYYIHKRTVAPSNAPPGLCPALCVVCVGVWVCLRGCVCEGGVCVCVCVCVLHALDYSMPAERVLMLKSGVQCS